uniref:Uncharacterized protein n=1 Tax=Romanomermis culicivorax TaxID=13658 RepID=A0A915IHV0_ROMCU
MKGAATIKKSVRSGNKIDGNVQFTHGNGKANSGYNCVGQLSATCEVLIIYQRYATQFSVVLLTHCSREILFISHYNFLQP